MASTWDEVIVAEYSREPRTQGGSPKVIREYRVTSESTSKQDNNSVRHTTTTTRRSLRHWIQYHAFDVPIRVAKDLFLPVGYPDSVEQGYFSYQVYDSLQGLCSYLRGVVSTSAVLKVAGVGDAQATAMSAAMTWAMRDGVGMIGGLCFSYFAAPLFDANIKEWRLFADVANDAGLTIDMLAPFWGSRWVLLVSSLSTICKTMCGISAGATKGSITQHFTRRGNVADLNAKESTQETLVSLIGMVLGVILARFLHRLEERGSNDAAFYVSWTIFVVLTVLHVIANYIGVKLLKLRTLNRERATCALQGVIDAIASDCQGAATATAAAVEVKDTQQLANFSIPPPNQVSESLFKSFGNIFYQGGNVVFGSKLSFMFRGLQPQELLFYLDEFRDENYLITIKTGGVVTATLRVGANDTDALKAFVHAMIIRKCLIVVTKPTTLTNHEIVQRSHAKVSSLFGEEKSTDALLSLKVLASRGWDVESRLNLGFGSRRIQWYGAKSE